MGDSPCCGKMDCIAIDVGGAFGDFPHPHSFHSKILEGLLIHYVKK
jgi:hypothetical protein